MGSETGKSTTPTSSVPAGRERLLTKSEFKRLSEVPPEAEWFANLTNANTKRAYRHDVTSFMQFVGIQKPNEFRYVTRAHVIAWWKALEERELAPATIRRKLSAVLIFLIISARKMRFPTTLPMGSNVREKEPNI